MPNSAIDYSLGNGGFLVSPSPPGLIFSREQLNEEQLEMGKTVVHFCKNKVRPLDNELEKRSNDVDGIPLAVKLFKEAGRLGIMGIKIPEEYGGMGMDFTTMVHATEKMSLGYGGFSSTCVCHMSIGTMPILLFGNESQKRRYLPKLATGEWLSSYALTEPGSGSDAFSGKTAARPEGDGYLLNGSKQFITNGGWADLSIVFARVDGEYSAFIVELNQKGVSRGLEEKKMGLKGSSTTTLTFEDVKISRENLLGEVGDAAKIALNVLNIGRLELAIGALGASRLEIDRVIEYGKQRRQFGRPIIEFDIQLARLADMAVKIFSSDSIIYRTVGAIDKKIELLPGENYYKQVTSVLRSYALEISICKVMASESFCWIAQNAIKLLGGYGYMEEYGAEKAMRDSILNMIVEGTNDINRLVIFDFLVRNIYNGGISYRQFMEEVDQSLRRNEFRYPLRDSILNEPQARLYAAKYAVAFLIQRALQRYGQDIQNNQQVIEHLSDLLIAVYSCDSVLARVHYLLEQHGEKQTEIIEAIARLSTAQNLESIRTLAQKVLVDLNEPPIEDGKRDLTWFLGHTESMENTFQLKRKIAHALIDRGHYYF